MENEAEDTVLDEHARWVQEIQNYDAEAQKWVDRSKRIMKRYKDERSTRETTDGVRRYNILYSNVQTLLPAYFSRTPKADIERRFKDKDDVGRIAAEVWERSVEYYISSGSFHHIVKQAVVDRLLCGRGMVWVRYVPHMGDMEISDEGVQITDDVDEQEKPQEIKYEETVCDYVYWEDFGHTVARTWEEVRACWRKVYLDRTELVERFGKELGSEIPLDYSPKKLNDEKIHDALKKAIIYEIWDKTSRKAIWLHKDFPKILDERDDPLGLDEFFPCPRPLFPTMLSDSLIPIPDYAQYQDQAKELDELTGRIAALTKAVKVAGVYDASAQGIERLLAEGIENKLLPIEQWAVLGDKGGLKGVMDLLPMQDIIKTLLSLYDARERVKNDLYEITGISDIIRGASKASETATAQNIKGKYAALRLDEGQMAVQRFCRDLVRIIAQIIANHFQPETIKAISGIHLLTNQEKQMVVMQQQMTGQPPQPLSEEQQEMLANPSWEDVFALLKDNATRCFRIDIETDSTVRGDQDEEKQARMEFLTAAGQYISQAATVARDTPELTPLLMQLLMFGVRGFPVGKQLETTFQLTLNKLEKKQQQAESAPPQPNPEMQKIQAQMQLEQAKLQAAQQETQADIQLRQAEAQADMQTEQQRMQLDAQKMQAELQLRQAEIAAKVKVEQDKLAADMQMQREKLAAEIQMKKEIEMMKLAMQQPDTEPGAAEILAPMQEMIKAMTAPKKITLDNGREATVEVA